MEAKRRLVQREITEIQELHPQFGQKERNDSQFSPLTSGDLAEELLSSKCWHMCCISAYIICYY